MLVARRARARVGAHAARRQRCARAHGAARIAGCRRAARQWQYARGIMPARHTAAALRNCYAKGQSPTKAVCAREALRNQPAAFPRAKTLCGPPRAPHSGNSQRQRNVRSKARAEYARRHAAQQQSAALWYAYGRSAQKAAAPRRQYGSAALMQRRYIRPPLRRHAVLSPLHWWRRKCVAVVMSMLQRLLRRRQRIRRRNAIQ